MFSEGLLWLRRTFMSEVTPPDFLYSALHLSCGAKPWITPPASATSPACSPTPAVPPCCGR
ncbi:hypothetical protein CBM2626_B160027 [Cupriavidus taiwanensis]|nr:hypothetical protein CBM2626_B160027 [Cupriavidus taiwanensis]